MPLEFKLREEEGFVESLWIGRMIQAQVFSDYQDFFRCGSWRKLCPGKEPRWLELANLTGTTSPISDPGWASEQARFFQRLYQDAGISAARVAVLAPDDLTFGLSRVYQLTTDGNLPESQRVFRDRPSAIRWLLQGDERDQSEGPSNAGSC